MVRTVYYFFNSTFRHPYTLFTIRLLNTARRLDWLLASARFGMREATAKLSGQRRKVAILPDYC
jgi:hypothetical protein